MQEQGIGEAVSGKRVGFENGSFECRGCGGRFNAGKSDVEVTVRVARRPRSRWAIKGVYCDSCEKADVTPTRGIDEAVVRGTVTVTGTPPAHFDADSVLTHYDENTGSY